jgi:hypothetical protein
VSLATDGEEVVEAAGVAHVVGPGRLVQAGHEEC